SEDFELVAIPERDDIRDVFVSSNGIHFQDLKEGAIIGTSSIRRAAMLKKLRRDLNIVPIRGNVQTRLDKMKKENIKQMFLNPIVVATFLGLLVWIFQNYLPQVVVSVEQNGETIKKSVAFLRIDHTFPQLFQVFKYLGGLSSPLAWLSIGSTLGAVSFKEAFSDKKTWYYTFIKLVLIPAINIVILYALNLVGFPINLVGLGTVVIMMATPPATVAVAYAINFDREALLASNASLMCTLGAVLMAPVWIVIIELIGKIGVFA
ncbi:MAG: AEC family transporter, partial [Anaerococcus sp.]|nr:AEC family transporter [Anaerococcus sp.]